MKLTDQQRERIHQGFAHIPCRGSGFCNEPDVFEVIEKVMEEWADYYLHEGQLVASIEAVRQKWAGQVFFDVEAMQLRNSFIDDLSNILGVKQLRSHP